MPLHNPPISSVDDMSRRSLVWMLAALLGIALTAGITWASSQLTSQRIGLSATQKPMELIGRFLVGNERPQPILVHIPQRRELDLAVEVPASELGPVASNEMWEEIYARIAGLVEQNRSTLIFVNTRRLAERVAHHLATLLGEDAVASHHGSLSRHRRLAGFNRA